MRQRIRLNTLLSPKAGQGLTEFALMLPVLMLILLGALDLGDDLAGISLRRRRQLHDP